MHHLCSSHPGSVPRPKITGNSSIYPHNQDHRAGLHSYGGAVRITCFNAVADQFYDQIEAGKVYFVSKGSVKPAQKAFNHLKNDHEIMLDSSSTIQPCYDDEDGQTLQNMCDSGRFPVLAIKSARVGEYNGKNLGTISTSKLFIDPDFPEAHSIKVWFDNGGNNLPSVSLSRENTDVRKTVSQIKEEKLGTSEKADWITVSGNASFLKVDSFYYTACPLMINDRKCNKKVINNGDGKWRCDRCDKDVDECDYRYILQFQIQDHTGTTWVTAFEKGGEAIMGVTAKDLYCMKYEEQDDERFTEIIRNVLITKYNFKLKVKEETFNDDPRVKITVTKAEKINFSSETSFLLDMLKKDHPSSLVPVIQMPTAGSGPKPPTGNFAYKESAPFRNYMRNASGVGRQSATVPASQMGQYGNQYGGRRWLAFGIAAFKCKSKKP
ncbi:replication protein A 70 kDa DNA-binding subunit A-like protein [Tanacetum coccineum]|uniref:Replication protein A 70 kDa DNA-binding subunit A-like protein n=1 Tax=Tanacetum coccineum TaxID=301880 RepID=A0ABQ5FVH9_9ASTR